MNNIIARENEPDSIKKLVAQRELYTSAKWLTGSQFMLSVILPVILAFAQLTSPKIDLNFELIIGLVSILALIVSETLLDSFIDSLKEKASGVQEAFDCYVLAITPNNVLCTDEPEPGLIFRKFINSKYKNDSSMLVNWYESEVATVPENIGKIICQRTNCNYDRDIKKRFKICVIVLAVIAIILILIPSFFFDWTVSKVLLTLICPALPVFQWVSKNISKINQSVLTLERLNTKITSIWAKGKQRLNIDPYEFRQIQDGIYLNRKQNPLIPDFIYKWLRKGLEDETRYTVSQLTREYLNP